MNLKKIILLILLIGAPTISHATLNVVTTTTDLAALAKEVGGNLITVNSIAKGYQDPHFVEAKPSYLLLLRKADLFIQVGLELEVAWAPPLLTNARNSKILPGNAGFLDVSDGCEILQKVSGGVDRSQGDVHPFGNPHYWLDPSNGGVIAANISRKLSELDPANASVYQANLDRFKTRLADKEKEWNALVAPLKGTRIITYHNSWPNFSKRFGIDVVNFIEPKPGIPASPAHIQALVTQIKKENIKLILMEPYFDAKLPEKISQQTGAKLLSFSPSVQATKDITTYFDLFDYDLKLLKDAAQGGS